MTCVQGIASLSNDPGPGVTLSAADTIALAESILAHAQLGGAR